jgi:hypothetical protein
MEIVVVLLIFFSISIWIKNDSLRNQNLSFKNKLEKIQDVDAYCNQRKHEIELYHKNKVNDANSISARVIREAYDHARVIKRTAEKAAEEIDEKARFTTALIKKRISDFPVIALAIADYETAKDTATVTELLEKSRPAEVAANKVKKIKEEKRVLIAQNKALKWEIAYIRQLLPWLSDLEDGPIEPINTSKNPTFTGNDDAGYWLTPTEYESLSDAEKYQLALDRYKKRHKSNWEIGRDYERYIGYIYETHGYSVEYIGITKGLEDLGRDLICRKGSETLIVQCKCWSNLKGKEIHENHINQLYGTTIVHQIECLLGDSVEKLSDEQIDYATQTDFDIQDIFPVFYSTVPFSKTARAFANILGVSLAVVPLDEYPMIKCNISKTGEKIYHLPFDQQYDKCIITPERDEFYATTVAEAEIKGFRRAMRWKGNQPQKNSSSP